MILPQTHSRIRGVACGPRSRSEKWPVVAVVQEGGVWEETTNPLG